MNKLPISAFIIAQNEVDRIAKTIHSLSFCDEIIVIDSGSTDGTQALAESLGAKVIFNTWNGYGEQKRFGEKQCKHDWLLNLDADEIITEALKQEIIQHYPFKASAFEFGFQDTYPGETKISPFAYIKRFIRLYNKSQASFNASIVHDTVDVFEGKIIKLKNPAHHYSTRSLSHALQKADHYTSMQAEDMIKRGKTPSVFRLLWDLPFSFVKSYILRRNIFRGKIGFIYSLFYVYLRYLRIAKAIELKLLERQKNV